MDTDALGLGFSSVEHPHHHLLHLHVEAVLGSGSCMATTFSLLFSKIYPDPDENLREVTNGPLRFRSGTGLERSHHHAEVSLVPLQYNNSECALNGTMTTSITQDVLQS